MSDPFHEWKTHARATGFVAGELDRLTERSDFLRDFRRRLRDETGTRLFDWVGHLAVRDAARFGEVGYQAGHATTDIYRHPQAMLPSVSEAERGEQVCLRVESVADFVLANGIRTGIDGLPLAPVRRAKISSDNGIDVWAVEQHGTLRWGHAELDAPVDRLLQHAESFRLRRRLFGDPAQGFRHGEELIRTAIDEIGLNRACDLFFAAEREYWQRRNRAARVQYARQDRLGLGWANHDHHTYRSGRRSFVDLIRVLELLGFECRERFYAGREAGWGAQVLEQPACRVVIFADVDLAPDEVSQDFAHEPLPERAELGTVGLWCELHGEAFLQAGMHHLEAQFDFDAARHQLAAEGVESMAPFTDFPYLKQAFTMGEWWPVVRERIDAALDKGSISQAAAEKFRQKGAIGSHLEILQRDDGYKGFNQSGISEIIRDTDPRNR